MSIPGNIDASAFIQRKVAAIVMDMPGVYTWKQRCIRLHPEESRMGVMPAGDGDAGEDYHIYRLHYGCPMVMLSILTFAL